MGKVFSGVWPLMLGILLIMLGNGMHFTLIGVRGGLEGFSTTALAIVTSGYFIGFLSGARLTPLLIRNVGHVRVFAALGSFMSAALIAFPLLIDPIAWTLLRILIGFCMSGIYVAAESWLNNASTNETRGKVLSAYMLMQTLGLIGAQALLSMGDETTSVLFIIASILVSLAFAPILLAATPVPAVEITRALSLRDLSKRAPLSTIGIFLLGSIYATQSGMGAVFGSQIGMSAAQVALLVAAFFTGALVLQGPMGWLSDRMDRRMVICGAATAGAVFSFGGWALQGGEVSLLATAFLAGGMTTPLYALFLAYANDWLAQDEMAAASGALVFTFGLGAILGPLVTGAAMERFGAYTFWLIMSGTFALIAGYAMWRMTQRPPMPTDETEKYVSVLPSASAVAVQAAAEWSAEQAESESED
ncbi:MAG: MFS transporter [Rhodobacteraceae bacterium]|nr:MAG: MFS transporter [Paracoccaceae bacterium]